MNYSGPDTATKQQLLPSTGEANKCRSIKAGSRLRATDDYVSPASMIQAPSNILLDLRDQTLTWLSHRETLTRPDNSADRGTMILSIVVTLAIGAMFVVEISKPPAAPTSVKPIQASARVPAAQVAVQENLSQEKSGAPKLQEMATPSDSLASSVEFSNEIYNRR